MTETQAVEMARAVAKAEGWAWIEPPLCSHRKGWFGKPGKWEIFSNRNAQGAKVRVVIDEAIESVIDKGYIPR